MVGHVCNGPYCIEVRGCGDKEQSEGTDETGGTAGTLTDGDPTGTSSRPDGTSGQQQPHDSQCRRWRIFGSKACIVALMWGSVRSFGSIGLGMFLLAGCADEDAVASGDTDAGSSSTGEASDSSMPTTTAPEPDSSTGRASDDAGNTTGGPVGSTGMAESTGSTSGTTGEDGPGPAQACYQGVFVNPAPLPNYDQFDVEVGSHCLGTNHQSIDDVDRVVFLGDSVTVGTPPTGVNDYYRSRLAEALADHFGLDTGGSFGLWKTPNAIDGTSLVRSSGDFWSCSEWGAKNDDFAGDNGQLTECFPPELDELTSLVVITMGGNDLASLARDAADGQAFPELFATAQQSIAEKREAIEWLMDPERFPNGNYVVFANIYEYTDATGDLQACDTSSLAGFEDPLPVPSELLTLVAWMEEQYGKIASEFGADFIFMFEEFCGHGFNADDPESLCYRGPGNENWFDLTCIHPTATGHGVIADMFLAVITE